MYFSTTTLSTTLFVASLVSSSSAAQWKMVKAIVKPSASTPFTITASHSESPIDQQPINAQQNAFYIGNTTVSSCPTTPEVTCPAGNVTALQTYSTGRASMDVEVPAGQAVYVNATDGALQYTVAHSNVFNENTTVKSFALFKGPTYSFFTFSGVGKASGFLACPVNETVYQVYADLPSLSDENVPNNNVSSCIGFDALATAFTGVSAWQYD